MQMAHMPQVTAAYDRAQAPTFDETGPTSAMAPVDPAALAQDVQGGTGLNQSGNAHDGEAFRTLINHGQVEHAYGDGSVVNMGNPAHQAAMQALARVTKRGL